MGDKRRRLKCRHFNGILNDACKLGIEYSTFRDKESRGLPCIETGGKCEKFDPFTEKEEADTFDELKTLMAKTLIVRALIVEHADKTHARSGVIDCPICDSEKSVRFTIAFNGHVHAACSTENCVRFME